MEMPKRIWAYPVGRGGGEWAPAPALEFEDESEYILASEYEKLAEALRGTTRWLEFVISRGYLPPDVGERATGDARTVLADAQKTANRGDTTTSALNTPGNGSESLQG